MSDVNGNGMRANIDKVMNGYDDDEAEGGYDDV